MSDCLTTDRPSPRTWSSGATFGDDLFEEVDVGQGSKGQRQGKAEKGQGKPRRRFGRVRQLPSKRWQARYLGPDGTDHTAGQTFATKELAERFLTLTEADLFRGDWVDPLVGQRAFGDWADDWLKVTVHLKGKTRYGYESILRTHVLPHFKAWEVGRIDRPAVKIFLAGLQANGIAPGTLANVRQVLRSVLGIAMDAGALKANPCDRVQVPRGRREEMHFLGHDQVAALAEAIAHPPVRAGGGEHRRKAYPEYGLLVRFDAYTGLRAGELAALRVGRVDLMHRAVEVAESASEVGGRIEFGEPKTYQHRRVPLPLALVDELAPFLAGRNPSDLAFHGPDGGPLRPGNFYARHFKPAVEHIGETGLRFHDLRHTYAGFLIGQGAHPRAMMERLGHSSITVTLDRYGHLLPGLEEAVTSGLETAYRKASVPPEASVVPFATGT